MKKAYNFFLALFPILSGYGLSPSADFGSLLLLLFGLGCLCLYPSQFKLRFPIGYAPFLVVTVVLSILWSQSIPLRLILFSVNLCLACSFSTYVDLWNYYRKIVLVCCVFFVIQEVSFLLLGSRPSGIFSFVPTIYGDNSSIKIEETILNTRSSSFFLEPSYFAQFLIPYVGICAFSQKVDERKKAILVSIIVLLIRSGIGVILVGFIWLFWFFFGSAKKRAKLLAVVLAIVGIGILSYLGGSLVDYFMLRSEELLTYTGDEQYQSSGFIRFFRGYFVFAEVPTLNKIFGSSPGVVQSTLLNNELFWKVEDHFINGFQTLLFHNGIIGAVLYLHHILLFPIKAKKKSIFVLTICIIVLLFGESFYLCSRLFLITALLYLITREEMTSNHKMISPIYKAGD